MIRRHERDTAPHGVPTSGQTQRAFGCDVHDLGLERIEKSGNGTELRQRKADRRIGRKRRRRDAQLTGALLVAVTRVARRDNGDLVAELAKHVRDTDRDCRDAVDLRRVSV